MKPAPFDYYEPKTLPEALNLLAQFGETAKPLAGGQSLVPMMNMRLARPAQLVDLNGLRELNYLKVENGELCIGAMTRQRVLERSAIVAAGLAAFAQKRRATSAMCKSGIGEPWVGAWFMPIHRRSCRWR